MKIVLKTHSYFPVLGGVQSMTHQLARELLTRGLSVQVLTRREAGLSQDDWLDGVPVKRYPIHLGEGANADHLVTRFINRTRMTHTFLRLAQHIRVMRPDIVHVHYPCGETLLLHLLRRLLSFRLVVTLHGNELGRPGHPASASFLYLLRSLLRSADAVTACSECMLADVRELVPEISSRSRVIHNCVDMARFSDQSIYQHPRPYIFAAGRLASEKGFDLLLDAYARSIVKDADLLIAGVGEEAESLRTQTARLGIDRQVCWLGQQSATEIVALLRGCQFVVVPSRAEAFGLTALESMAAGKRVLSTRVGGLQQLVPEPPNRLVAPTVAAIAQGLESMWAKSSEATEAASRVNQDRARQFGVQEMVDQYLAIYAGDSQ